MSTIKLFNVTAEHIKLLRAAYIRWNDCEYGAPTIDPKRPYGNSDVETDLLEILGVFPANPGDETEEPSFTQAQIDKAVKVHKETETALQIFLATGEMKEGTYQLKGYGKGWTRLDQ